MNGFTFIGDHFFFQVNMNPCINIPATMVGYLCVSEAHCKVGVVSVKPSNTCENGHMQYKSENKKKTV